MDVFLRVGSIVSLGVAVVVLFDFVDDWRSGSADFPSRIRQSSVDQSAEPERYRQIMVGQGCLFIVFSMIGALPWYVEKRTRDPLVD